jgi:hypothetical protein
MRVRTFLLVLAVIALVVVLSDAAMAQCALCKANAESSVQQGDSTAKGLNAGIMYLLIIPYALVAGLGYWWYTRMRKTEG